MSDAKLGGQKPPLLVITHCQPSHLRIRTLEFARRLQHRYDIYCLRWPWVGHVAASHRVARKAKQLRVALSAFHQRQRIAQSDDGIVYIDIPFLEPALVSPLMGAANARRLSRWFNTRRLEQVLIAFDIRKVLSASILFDHPVRVPDAQVFFDIIDYYNPWEENRQLAELRKVWLPRHLARAACNFAVSQKLANRFADDFGATCVSVPNGVDLDAMRGVDPQAVAQLRRQLGAEDRYIMGYIGNHIPHSGLDFLLRTFAQVRVKRPDALLLIVGPYGYWESKIADLPKDGVHFTGAIPPSQIAPYFHVLDMAVAPFEKWDHTDHSIPLTVLEYTAARKLVVVTDLDTLPELALPNVRMTSRHVDQWVDTIERTRHERWQPQWDAAIEPYDWRALAECIALHMDAGDPAGAEPAAA